MNNAHPNVPERVFRIIEEALNKTTERGASPAEAENAAKMVQEILLKYNLTLTDIHGKKKDGKRQFNQTTIDLGGKQKRHDSTWVSSLVNVISRHNLCKAILFKGTKRMCIVGESHNVEIVLYLVDQLIPKIEAACSSAWSKYYGEEKRNTFRRGFLAGCVAGIDDKLYEQEARMAAADNQVMALVKVNNTELMEYVTKEFTFSKPNNKAGNLRKSSDSKVIGFEAGRNMEIHKGLNGNSTAGFVE